MPSCTISNKWCLPSSAVQALSEAGLGTKLNWWAKNLTTNQFFNYEQQLGGHRIPGESAFQAQLDMEPGEYKFACGDWNVIDPETQRHCAQTFYVYVDENGAHVCKRNELPSQRGTGFSNAPAPVKYSASTWNAWGAAPAQPAKSEEYFVFPSYVGCLNDMIAKKESDICDAFEAVLIEGPDECANCTHSCTLYAKKD